MKTKAARTKKIKKGITALCMLVLLSGSIKSQDIITYTNGDEIGVRVVEVNDTEIKCKKMNNLNGPNYVISKNEVFSIKYENGSKMVFSNNYSPIYNEATATKPSCSKPADNKFDKDSSDFAKIKQKRFSGPRIGYTMIEGQGTISEYMRAKGGVPFATQFGWQFETRIFTVDENGTQGLVEFVPLIGGMEQGLFLPSASLLIGLRSGGKRAYEFAVGPNLSLAGLGMVIAVGTSFEMGKVNFPVNLAFIPSVGTSAQKYNSGTPYTEITHTGFRVSLMVGFNVRKK